MLRNIPINQLNETSALDAKNLLIFGRDLFPERKTSEVNFWNDMVENFAASFKEVIVLSVNNRPIKQERLCDNVYLYNVKPYYVGNTMKWKDPEYSGSRFDRLPLSIVYRTLSFVKYLPTFEHLIKKHNVGVVHYMRVFGLLNEILIKRHSEILFTITVPTHIDRGFPLHAVYHMIKNMGLRPMDKIIPTSLATRNKLQKLGIEKSKLQVIHWSLKQGAESELTATTDEIRASFDIKPSVQVVLWSGPLQHTGAGEFFFALEVAKKVVQNSEQFAFVFAFKPDELKSGHLKGVPKVNEIKLLETDRSEFLKLKRIASIFLSPVCNKNRTVAPPLTWIEMMLFGIPVITTNVEGVEELITHNKEGFIVDGIENTVELLLNLNKDDLGRVGKNCRMTTNHQYDLGDISAQYIAMWKTALLQKQHFVNRGT